MKSTTQPLEGFRNLAYLVLANVALVTLVILSSCTDNHARQRNSSDAAIVPAPEVVVHREGEFEFSPLTVISVEDDAQQRVAELFAWCFASSAGFVPEVARNVSDATVKMMYNQSLDDETYLLDVRKDGIIIEASSEPGFFYATQTLRLALPPHIDSDSMADNVRWCVPAMLIEDSPKYRYRGLMVDVSRYFLPKDDLLKIIDCMGMLKLNNLHLHLTDDNGWRIEIRKYPELTSVGAWRVDRESVPFPDRENPQPDEKATVGGFYTQEDIRQIVDYAAERQINVIPEIDIPAHSNSALASYPQYACPVVEEHITVLPGLGGSKAEILYCAGNDRVLTFLKDVLDEICELFPSEYIHLGGDEAVKTYWKKCPLCQDRIEREGLVNEEELQGWFMSRMNDYLRSKGRKMMGWDELTRSDIPEEAVIFGWNEDGDAALKAASCGHDFVLTPAKVLYLIRYQGPQWFEPLTYFGNSTLKNVYDYEPVKDWWPEGTESFLLGLQASMWTEFCASPDDVTYQIFPRLAAFSEVAWSGEKDWRSFLKALDSFLLHLDEKGVVYARSMFNIQHQAVPHGDGSVFVSLQCERPDVTVRYTLDGSDPSGSSDIFVEDINIKENLWLKSATFYDDGTIAGRVLEIPFRFNKATGCPITSDLPHAEVLVNGIRGSLRQTDFEWCQASGRDAEFIIDLGTVQPVDKVTVGFLTNYGMGFHKPASVAVRLSEDGVDYETVGLCEWDQGEIFRKGNFKEDISFPTEGEAARYVKVSTAGAGECPQWHIRPGFMSKYCIDEVLVE